MAANVKVKNAQEQCINQKKTLQSGKSSRSYLLFNASSIELSAKPITGSPPKVDTNKPRR